MGVMHPVQSVWGQGRGRDTFAAPPTPAQHSPSLLRGLEIRALCLQVWAELPPKPLGQITGQSLCWVDRWLSDKLQSQGTYDWEAETCLAPRN